MGMVLEAGESVVLRVAGHSLVLPEVSGCHAVPPVWRFLPICADEKFASPFTVQGHDTR